MLRIVVSDRENSWGGIFTDVMVEGDSATEAVAAYLDARSRLTIPATHEKPDE